MFVKIWIPSTPGCFVPNLVEIGPVVLKRGFLNIFNIILLFLLLFPLWEGHGPSFEQTWISSTQGCFLSSLVEIGPVVLEKKLKMWKVNRQMDRRTDRQTDEQTMDNRRSEKLTWAFSSFCYYLPLEKRMALHLNKFESPPTKDALCQVWFKLAQWFWRRFLNIFNII